MASARDIAPIVLAGLAGALGGNQSARAIGNAAEISRRSRLDKEESERRKQIMARSARQLELSEEAAKRAEESHNMTMTRQKLGYERDQKIMKDAEKAEANFRAAYAGFAEANPEVLADPTWRARYEIVADNPAHFQQFADMWANSPDNPNPSGMTFADAREAYKDLPPNVQVTTDLAGGGRASFRGALEQPDAPPVDHARAAYGNSVVLQKLTSKYGAKVEDAEIQAARLDQKANQTKMDAYSTPEDVAKAQEAAEDAKRNARRARIEMANQLREELYKLNYPPDRIEEIVEVYENPGMVKINAPGVSLDPEVQRIKDAVEAQFAPTTPTPSPTGTPVPNVVDLGHPRGMGTVRETFGRPEKPQERLLGP